MQIKLRTLFGGIVTLLSLQAVDSSSVSHSKRGPSQLLTLPLTPVKQRSVNIDPHIHLQMHIHRAIRRLARMTGAEPPSSRSLERRLEKGVISIEASEVSQADTGPPESSPPTSSTPDVQYADPPSAPNSLGLDIDSDDVGYFATVQIGTPPQNFFILMDSGSADFWVGAENCRSQDGGGCGDHTFLGAQSSSSFKSTGRAFELSYGKGFVSGSVVQDNVVIAGLSLTNHVFGVASVESVQFSSNDTPFDGLMGLAKSRLSEQGTPTPIESLASAGLVPAPIVSYKIPRLADNLHDGEITFGGLDQTKFDPKTLVSVPNINLQGFWEAKLDGATVNGIETGLTGRTTILDTGTSLMILPLADAAAIHMNIPGAKQVYLSSQAGYFSVPCTSNASVALIYAGHSFTIDPRDLPIYPLDANNPYGDCLSGITSSGDSKESSKTQWLVGDTFLKNAYFSTDVSKNTVSLAKLNTQH